VAAYAGWQRIQGDTFDYAKAHLAGGNEKNDIAHIGLIAKAPIGNKLEAYAKGAVGTKHTSEWEAGLGYKATKDLDLKAGYKYLNTELADDASVTFKGFTTGLSYRFGGHTEEAPAPAPVVTPVTPAPVVEQPAPVVKRADYYTTSIYFDSDIDTPRADQAPNLAAALNAANQYSNDRVKLVGNADSSYNADYNQALSERRVQSVAQYLVNNGVNSNRIVGLANGDRKPAESNATAAGKAENRRVDVYINR
ncbi:MAG: OmpA family protein, partial [Veillonella sp.]|nr:OmpA family protein [Veillonella sp.]